MKVQLLIFSFLFISAVCLAQSLNNTKIDGYRPIELIDKIPNIKL